MASILKKAAIYEKQEIKIKIMGDLILSNLKKIAISFEKKNYSTIRIQKFYCLEMFPYIG